MRDAPLSFRWTPFAGIAVTSALFFVSVGTAVASPPQQVSVDWSRVPDEVVARCDLAGLENLMVQELLAAGLAMVSSVSSEGFAVALSAGDDVLRIDATQRGELAQREVAIPTGCDSSIQLDLTHAMLDAVRELYARSRHEPVRGATVETAASAWELRLGAMVVVPATRFAGAGVGAGVRYHLPSGPVLGGGIETALSRYGGILIAEPALVGQVLVRAGTLSGLDLRLGGEAAALRHMFWTKDSSGGRWDVRVGLAAELCGERVVLGLLPYLRRLSIRHIVGERVAYESAVWGVHLRASVGIL